MSDLLWPLAIVAIALLAWNAVCRWLKRDSVEYTKLADKQRLLATELSQVCVDWTRKFEGVEQRQQTLDASIKSLVQQRAGDQPPRANPLGRNFRSQ